ncbi:MAG TPA: BamA/TamA family outer membrane protein, partial [Gemmatimonadaceae bacterium]
GPIQSKSVSAVFDAYKSVDVAGFAHEVLAARVAGGVASGADPGVYDIGGSNGTPVSVFPGFTLGSRHTFAVRGFPSGIRSGDRVLAGSLEYRVPFLAPHRGLGFWPAFLDRTSINLFSDAGTTWTKGDTTLSGKPIASAGAEVVANLGLQYDAPYVARAGIAFPYINNSPVKVSPASVYFEIGFAF